MENLTFIFTTKVDSAYRLLNIKATLKFYTTQFPRASFIFLEADSKPSLKDFIKVRYPYIEYYFVHDTNPIFHRTHYINEELRYTKTPFAAIVDSDIIVPQKQIYNSVKILHNKTKVIMVYPYDGRFIGLDAYYSDIFRKTCNISNLIDADVFNTPLFGFRSVGGIFIVDVSKYRTCGWENEYFPGWGPEDFEREHRLDILGYKPSRVQGKIYHLNHPRGINSSNSYEPLILATKREYCKVCSMMPDELRDYIATWPWIK